jgi:hypothetical protein
MKVLVLSICTLALVTVASAGRIWTANSLSSCAMPFDRYCLIVNSSPVLPSDRSEAGEPGAVLVLRQDRFIA